MQLMFSSPFPKLVQTLFPSSFNKSPGTWSTYYFRWKLIANLGVTQSILNVCNKLFSVTWILKNHLSFHCSYQLPEYVLAIISKKPKKCETCLILLCAYSTDSSKVYKNLQLLIRVRFCLVFSWCRYITLEILTGAMETMWNQMFHHISKSACYSITIWSFLSTTFTSTQAI